MTDQYQSKEDRISQVSGGSSGTRAIYPPSRTYAVSFNQIFYNLVPFLLLGLVLFLWLLSLPYIQPDQMSDLGLLSVLPLPYYAALILLTGSFAVMVFQRPERRGILFLYIVAFILIIHATPAIVYGTLRYPWSWKHVGIVEYILRHNSIDPTINFLNVYQNWPGFFAFSALLTQATGQTSAMGFAIWATPFFNLLYLGALLLIFRALSEDYRVVWLSAWIFYLANWIGQDYFSPQSFAYLYYLLIVGILLRWFARARPALAATAPPTGRWSRARTWLRVRAEAARITASSTTPTQRVLLMVIVIFAMIAIAASHQLTPLITVFALLALVLFGLIYPRSLPFLALVFTLAWIYYVASFFVNQNLGDMLETVGAVESNLSSSLINLSEASPGQAIISFMGRTLTFGVLILALLGFILRLLSGRLDLAAALLVVVPFGMLAANSYGGEIVFRIYFFALPFMAFFIASMFVMIPATWRDWGRAVTALILSLAILSGFLFGYYGKERQYYFSQNEVDAANVLYQTALPGSLIIEGTRSYPTLFANYEYYTYVPIDREPAEDRQEILADPVGVMARWMDNRQYPGTYLIITRSMKAYVDMVGSMPRGSLDAFEQQIIASGQFDILYQNKDAAIYTLKGRTP